MPNINMRLNKGPSIPYARARASRGWTSTMPGISCMHAFSSLLDLSSDPKKIYKRVGCLKVSRLRTGRTSGMFEYGAASFSMAGAHLSGYCFSSLCLSASLLLCETTMASQFLCLLLVCETTMDKHIAPSLLCLEKGCSTWVGRSLQSNPGTVQAHAGPESS